MTLLRPKPGANGNALKQHERLSHGPRIPNFAPLNPGDLPQ